MNIHNETNLYTKPKTELRQSYKCCFTYFSCILKETVDCQFLLVAYFWFVWINRGGFDCEGKCILYI